LFPLGDDAQGLKGGKAIIMSQETSPDGKDLVHWELVGDELLVLDASQSAVYRFTGEEPDQLRHSARNLLVGGLSDRVNMASDDELASVADFAANQQSGMLSRRALIKTAAAAGIAIGFSTLRLPTAAAQGSVEATPTVLAAIPSANSVEVIGSP
jgi:hypothetical protein